jgi:hypothetical protein
MPGYMDETQAIRAQRLGNTKCVGGLDEMVLLLVRG